MRTKIYFRKKKASDFLRHNSLEKRKSAEASEGTYKRLLMKIQVFRYSKIKCFSFSAQSNSFDQSHNMTVGE